MQTNPLRIPALIATAMLLLAACPSNDLDVGTAQSDSALPPESTGTGGTISGTGGAQAIGTGGAQTIGTGGAQAIGTGGTLGTDGVQAIDGGWGTGGSTVPATRPPVGAPCDVGVPATASQGVYNSTAPECWSNLCLKPVVQENASIADTGAFCTTKCEADTDCAGILRDPTNPNDKACVTGYTCGIAFVKGRICCQKLCLCKDFLGPAGAPTPIACQGVGAATCNQ